MDEENSTSPRSNGDEVESNLASPNAKMQGSEHKELRENGEGPAEERSGANEGDSKRMRPKRDDRKPRRKKECKDKKKSKDTRSRAKGWVSIVATP